MDMAYIGIKDGTVRAIVFDDPNYKEDTARFLGEWVVMGRTIERVSRDEGMRRIRTERENARR